jgi:hypothetical protein
MSKNDDEGAPKSDWPELRKSERIFLSIVTIFIITVLITDLWYFMGMVDDIRIPLLAYGNIGAVVLAFISIQLKKRIRRRFIRKKKRVEAGHSLMDEGLE